MYCSTTFRCPGPGGTTFTLNSSVVAGGNTFSATAAAVTGNIVLNDYNSSMIVNGGTQLGGSGGVAGGTSTLTANDSTVVAALLENKTLDCRLLSELAVKLMKRQNRDADDPNVARLNELLPSKCPNTTR